MTSNSFNFTPETLRGETLALRGHARALLSHDHDADDAGQEAWLAAVRKPPTKLLSRRAWLNKVTCNFARRTHRHNAARQQREQAAARTEAVPSAADSAERLAVHRQVVDALLGLDEIYRTVLVSTCRDGMPPREVARERHLQRLRCATWRAPSIDTG